MGKVWGAEMVREVQAKQMGTRSVLSREQRKLKAALMSLPFAFQVAEKRWKCQSSPRTGRQREEEKEIEKVERSDLVIRRTVDLSIFNSLVGVDLRLPDACQRCRIVRLPYGLPPALTAYPNVAPLSIYDLAQHKSHNDHRRASSLLSTSIAYLSHTTTLF